MQPFASNVTARTVGSVTWNVEYGDACCFMRFSDLIFNTGIDEYETDIQYNLDMTNWI